jgi:hypothetical protein
MRQFAKVSTYASWRLSQAATMGDQLVHRREWLFKTPAQSIKVRMIRRRIPEELQRFFGSFHAYTDFSILINSDDAAMVIGCHSLAQVFTTT